MTWKEFKKLLVKEYTNEAMAIEAVRSFMKLVQIRDETPEELGVRDEKMAT